VSLSERADFTPPELQDDEQFGLLYRRHNNWLVDFLRRHLSSPDAEDLAQDTFVRALDGRDQIRNPRAFLAQLAKRAAVDQGRQLAACNTATAEHIRRQSLDRALDATDTLALKQAVLCLPPKLREVFLLSRFVGLTYADIANRCGVSVDTVKERLTKAQTMCSALMRD
jgi:RNA polymerase sigma-70 factor (ECF subfamily)